MSISLGFGFGSYHIIRTSGYGTKTMDEEEYSTPFSLLQAASLLSQRTRLAKFEQALQQVITEDSYVVDLGTGTGILAMLAAKAGAKKVTAVEIDRRSAEYAEQAIRSNGLSDVIEVVRSHYVDFRPARRADIVTCEMLSSVMLIEPQIPACQWAVDEILKEDGILLPQSVTVYVAPVECHHVWKRFVPLGLVFPRVPQTMSKGEYRDLADLKILHHFAFNRTRRGEWNVKEDLTFDIISDGTVHGFAGLFEARLTQDIKLTMDDGWRDLLLPLDEPILVSEGNILSASVYYVPAVVDSLRMRASTEKR
ncbi:MAG: 50S ribosomal protein L11 methyltransferase [Candidatus Thorarchaeota archaeon]